MVRSPALAVPAAQVEPEVLEVLASQHHLEEHLHHPCPAGYWKHRHSAVVSARSVTIADVYPNERMMSPISSGVR